MEAERGSREERDEERVDLAQRVRELEAEVARLRDRDQRFTSILDSLPLSIYLKDREGACTYANAKLLASFGRPLEQVLGTTVYDYYPRALAEKYDADERRVVESGETFEEIEEHLVPATGEKLYVRVIKSAVRDASGAIIGTQGVFWDVTSTFTAERLAREVEQQSAALRKLGTPLLPIAAGVVVMPLIGDIDRDRAERVLDTLLRGVSDLGASFAILDVTGVTNLDEDVANVLLQAARAVGLLGAEVVLTGMKPHMAHAIVTMGVELTGIATLSTLQAGVTHALRRRQAR